MIAKRHLFFITQNYSYSILRPLQQAIIDQGGEVAWFLSGNELNYDYLQINERRVHDIASAIHYSPDVVYAPGNVIPDMIPGIKVNLSHGFNVDGKPDHFTIRHFFDLYCTQGPDTTAPFQELAEQYGYFSVIETGWPKLDPLFANTIAEPKNDKPTVLYASTFSKRLTSAPYLINHIKELAKNTDWHWLVTLHPKTSIELVNAYKALQSDNLEFIETDDLIPTLRQADAMLCDTSSIMYEFLLTRKPVVTYQNKVSNPYFLNTNSVEELQPLLAHALSRPNSLIQEIKKYTATIHPYTDGKSSLRVLEAVDWFLKTGHKGLCKKPLNLIRRIKIRKQLAYHKW